MNHKAEHKILDTTGLVCPEPVMLLHKAMRDSVVGDVIEVLATDPATQRDIPAFCEFLGHELIAHESEEKSGLPQFIYRIRKAARAGRE